MGISLSSRIIADTRLTGIHGARMAGGYLLRISVEFNVLNWEQAVAPTVVFSPAKVYLRSGGDLFLGSANPETIEPFKVTKYSRQAPVLFDLPMTAQAMNVIERQRDGGDIALTVKLLAEVRSATELAVTHDEVYGTFTASQWLAALEQAGFGRFMLFEVPLPADLPGLTLVAEQLESARHHFSQGRYSDVVAACRLALEALTKELGQENEMQAMRDQFKRDKRELTLAQRELVMRQSITDFSHLAHHPAGTPLGEMFDRNSAQLALGSTAALVSSAMSRRSSASRLV